MAEHNSKMHYFQVFVVLTLGMDVSASQGLRCSGQEIDKGKDAVIYETVRYGHYIELECCSREGGPISWMRWLKHTNQWQRYVPDRDDVILLESSQILEIQSAIFEDAGSYKCIEQNSSAPSIDLKKFELKVVACDKLARGPYPVSPLPCAETIATEKESITLPCTGYFGCSDKGDIRIVKWYVSESIPDDKTDNWKEVSEVDDRYTVTRFEFDSGTVVGQNMTIKSISAVDFKRRFMCLLASPQIVKGQSRILVTLKKRNKTGDGSILVSGFDSGEVLIVMTVVVVVLLIIVSVLVGLCLQKHLAKTHRKRRGNMSQEWGMKYKSSEDSGQMLP